MNLALTKYAVKSLATKSQRHPRQTATECREALVDAAVEHVAMTALHGTAVGAISDDVGITQPYAFGLFGTKSGLFLAAVARGFDRVEEIFRAEAGEDGAFEDRRSLPLPTLYGTPTCSPARASRMGRTPS